MAPKFSKEIIMNISPEIKVELESRARQTKDKHEHTRLCVILARSEGMSIELIAQAHRISRDSIYRYLEEYETEEKTRHGERGGSQSKLSEALARELIEHLRGTTYLYAKHICNYVRATYGVSYTISGMRGCLKIYFLKIKSGKNDLFKIRSINAQKIPHRFIRR